MDFFRYVENVIAHAPAKCDIWYLITCDMLYVYLYIYKTDNKWKSKNKKTLFNVGQCKQHNMSFRLKWVLVADKSTHMIKYHKHRQ